MCEKDLTNFPDDLFCCEILTRLPLKDAVRFSAVSRKWYRAWTRLPHLKFSAEFFYSIPTDRNAAVDIINKIICMQCFDLETLKLDNCEWCKSSIPKWISLSGVKCVDLKCNNIQMEVSKSIFSCVTVRSLSLNNFKMKKVPPLFQGFSQLVTLYLVQVKLSKTALEAILKSCHLLESLTLSECGLPSALRIFSSSLKSLALFLLESRISSIEANCPKLESITFFDGYVWKTVNMCLPMCVHLETDFPNLEDLATVKSFRKITIFDDEGYEVDCTHVQVLQTFPLLEELRVENLMFIEERLPELSLRLPNLKIFIVNTIDADCALMLCSCVLKGAPLLKTIRIGMNYNIESSSEFHQIVNNFQSLARDFPKTQISVSRTKIV